MFTCVRYVFHVSFMCICIDYVMIIHLYFKLNKVHRVTKQLLISGFFVTRWQQRLDKGSGGHCEAVWALPNNTESDVLKRLLQIFVIYCIYLNSSSYHLKHKHQ